MNYKIALAWLYDQLKKRRIALGCAERKKNAPAAEIENIKSTIEVLEWLIGRVLESEGEQND